MSLDRLRHAPLHGVKLKSALDLEPRWVLVGRDTDQDEPLTVRRNLVPDDLVVDQVLMTVEHLERVSSGALLLVLMKRVTELTFVGAVWPSMTFQWYTSLSVTIPSVVSLIHVQ